MKGISLEAFADEIEKTAFLGKLWQKVVGMLDSGDEAKQKHRVDYFFSPKAGPDKWTKFDNNIKSKEYLSQVADHPGADKKLIQFANAMHEVANAPTVGKVQSERLGGRSYEIRKIPGGLACTCPDWKYVGSTKPGYECKHVRAHKQERSEV